VSTAIRLTSLRKEFGDVVAVDSVDLDVADGEFLTLLGPSGSGKTTVLRMIAGFEQPTSGTIELAGVDVTQVPPYSRDVNTVFQDYALFPHMDVLANVEYGLKVKKVSKAERRQRVALARALVNRPRVLLLDEPLGALDLKLREQMQVELKELQRAVGITFVFVTHDQEEALTMSDRIAVFDAGRIAQIGTPVEIYEHPRTPFVAGFVGVSNLLEAGVAATLLGREGLWSVRPEKIRVLLGTASPEGSERAAAGVIREVVYVGMSTRFIVDLDAGATLIAVQQNSHATSSELGAMRGQRVTLMWNTEHEIPVG
jgi:putative spermidine/putrescine transport system ATP-binding protein